MVFSAEKDPIEIPNVLPLLPVRDIVVFSYMFLPLFVGRESSIMAVDEAMKKNRLILLATQKNPAEDNPTPNDIYPVGTVAMIMRKLKLPGQPHQNTHPGAGQGPHQEVHPGVAGIHGRDREDD